jgi:hypothetical protein
MSFADTAIFWTNHGDVDTKVSLIPDFISNCGMARVLLTLWKRK